MNRVTAGIISGFVATVALSALMLVKSMLGLAPEMNVIRMLSNLLSGPPAVGWLAHFFIGTIGWGVLFVLLQQVSAQRNFAIKGMLFGFTAWLLMMIALMPTVGAGFFGLGIGPIVPVMTLVLHLIFGAILGYTFDRLRPPAPPIQES